MDSHFPEPTARLMLRCFRQFEQHLLRVQKASGISLADLTVLRHLNPEGMSVTHLADDVGISKQAVSRTVKDLESKGMVKLTTDPGDSRVKIVQYSAKGKKFIAQAITTIEQFEQTYLARLGEEPYQSLRDSLIDLEQWHRQQNSE